MTVHNHGLDPSCSEAVVDGSLKGACMADLKTPTEWAAIEHVEILDPDGWRVLGSPPFDQAITQEEFRQRLIGCTLRIVPMENREQQGARWAG